MLLVSPVMSALTTTVMVDLNSSALLTCSSAANPAPVYNWTLGPLALSNSSRFQITQGASAAGGQYQSTLIIWSVTQADIGAPYACRASNDIGWGTTNFGLALRS